jgi:predicted RNA-binding Zn ribbon-like protein
MATQQTPNFGEPVALRLANSIVHASGRSRDLFDDIEARRGWARQLGREDLTPADVVELRRLRSRVRELLGAAADGRAPGHEALDGVNAASAAVPDAVQLNWPPGGTPSSWRTSSPAGSLERAMATIARSAIELLCRDHARIRRCGAHGCATIFVAADSRKRWCSARCGNRVRVARHAARRRG